MNSLSPFTRLRRAICAALVAMHATAAAALCLGDGIEALLPAASLGHIARTEAETPFAKGLVWQAEKEGRRIYLMGTMHLHDPRFDPIVARMTALLLEADSLLVEADEASQQQMQRSLAADTSLVFIQDGPSLVDIAGPQDWARIAAAAQARGIPPFALARAQPWYANLTLSIPACAMPELMAGQQGVDARLIAAATAAGIPTASIEPWQDMIAILTYGDLDWQYEELRLSLVAPELEARIAASMFDYYLQGRIAAIWALPQAVLGLMPEIDPATFERHMQRIEASLLVGRNAQWLPRIETASAGAPVLAVAVGAAHLIGAAGLLAGLERKGWAITPLD